MNYALMVYNYTTNLGNEIQTIAARRFLPKIDYYIDHEKINLFNEEDNVKMIMNGWYLDCEKAWPPSESIDPLLISMHFNTTSSNKERLKALLSDESIEYFMNHAPIGCRDYSTVEFLNEQGIDAYFSGCLTLTLDNGKTKEERELDKGQDYIVVNSEIADEIISFLKDKTDKKIYRIQQDMIPSFDTSFPESMPLWLYNLSSFYDYEEKLFMAENLLRIYENASCVITDRLHCALPSLALETPVMLLNNRGFRERFDGLSNLLLESDIDSYESNYNIFDVDNPPENPKDYLKIRKDLIEKSKKFTGHINNSYYSDISQREIFERNNLLLSRNAIGTRDYIRNVLKRMRQHEKDISKKEEIIKNQEAIIDKQKKMIDEMKGSNSWKITSPLRKIRK
ncbi:hypothetical protein mru_0100 [Methanobrevibacter ruminantium M1]|uniref:Polysaccharide pyruvyl transferase domain-containing protein n=1 Tax=Methanobrevibacter ruminantium (strain ATCC 35063 / DSM 1093 / JCM 13430 / OCM 146 / M1) TaxID=634498 RepID=D3DYN2_METRM|nr:polysaccharide pyruvyl transferase family protein [Methanobrevibacter ruminantium]ADC45952.1 hypothetical protein mru_0100 [Methanobrevibacter ruminantium M1]